MKIIKIVLLFILSIIISIINCDDSLSSSTNNQISEYIYSVTSNDQPLKGGQTIIITDKITNQQVLNYRLNKLPHSINGIISVDESTMSMIVLCDWYYLVEISLKDNIGEFVYLGSIPSQTNTEPFMNAIQPIPFNSNGNNVYLPIVFQDKNTSVSMININFNENSYQSYSFNSTNFTYLNGPPFGTFDSINNNIYIIYPSQVVNDNTTFPLNLISFTSNEINTTQSFYNNILNQEYVELLFTDSIGNLYILYGNPETSSYDACLVNLSNSSCNLVFSVTIDPNQVKNFQFLSLGLNGSKDKLIIISFTNNSTQLIFNQVDLLNNNYSKTQFIIDNIWSNVLNDNIFTYFYLP